jgi:ATP-dependent RNA helicase RhlE
LLFSATFPDAIRALAQRFQRNPGVVEVARRNATAEGVNQLAYWVDQSRKRDLLTHLIWDGVWKQVLVFTRTKHGADRLAKHLEHERIETAVIHGDKSQGVRTRALADFKRQAVRVLVATDIAARGLDITDLPHVVNYELPHVAEDYVHRIGRTGRAGREGTAVSLVSHEERERFEAIRKLVKVDIPATVVTGFEPPQTPRSAPKSNPKSKARPAGQPHRERSGANAQVRTWGRPGARSGNRRGRNAAS